MHMICFKFGVHVASQIADKKVHLSQASNCLIVSLQTDEVSCRRRSIRFPNPSQINWLRSIEALKQTISLSLRLFPTSSD
jgi:hypothetical protein